MKYNNKEDLENKIEDTIRILKCMNKEDVNFENYQIALKHLAKRYKDEYKSYYQKGGNF